MTPCIEDHGSREEALAHVADRHLARMAAYDQQSFTDQIDRLIRPEPYTPPAPPPPKPLPLESREAFLQTLVEDREFATAVSTLLRGAA